MSINTKQQLAIVARQLCRDLRKRSTPAEQKLWQLLRNRKLDNKKFLRQHPVFYDVTGRESFFIADFYCYEESLVVELDGEYHNYRLKEDTARTEILNHLGLRVIRFTNKEVLNNVDNVLERIRERWEE